MANVSFAGLDQSFNIGLVGYVEFGSYDGYTYSYLTTSGHDWEVLGAGLTDNGTVLTGGTVTGLQLDLFNDSDAFELDISGLSLAVTSLGLNAGTPEALRDSFWAAALGGADTFDFHLVNYAVTLIFAGDGANVSDGALHVGTSEIFADPGSSIGNGSIILGDYLDILSGIAVGGNDTFSLGATAIIGDWRNVGVGATGIGGDDIITPARIDANVVGPFSVSGDGAAISGALFAGNDLIDLRNTDFTGYGGSYNLLTGDAGAVSATGALSGGNDTIHGSQFFDAIFGDYQSNAGYVEGGKDRLFGYAGNDQIFGNSGRDQLYGGDGDDSLDGGIDGDIIDGGLGNDFMIGDTGNDIMTGGDGNDTMLGGSGHDTIDGGVGDDAADAAAGNDVMIGGTGKDSLFGGTGNDSITGDGGNDTLQGGDNNDTLDGGAGFDVLLGGNGDDTLDGGASNDILLGNAGNDTFIFSLGSSTDTIRDFVAGAGVADVIDLVGFGAAFDTFAEVMAAATDNGTDTTINFGNGDILIIQNVTVAGFNADDFIFG